MATFPNSIASFATLVDGVDSVLAAHQNLPNDEIVAIETWLRSYQSGNQGYGDNYVITPSISTNNLVFEIKTLSGGNPSSTSPAKFHVGDGIYWLTAAVSFTKAAGTNWMNCGSTENKDNSLELFVYAIAETGASAGLKFGYSRIPWADTMGDFVNTNTDEKYIAGNWTNFNSTDKVINIGSFRAQLSGTASFNWSIPSAKVINRLVHESDWMTWTPTAAGVAPLTYSFSSVAFAKYKLRKKEVIYKLRGSGTLSGSAGPQITITLPFKSTQAANVPAGGYGNTAAVAARVLIQAGPPDVLNVAKYDTSNYATSGTNAMNIDGSYEA